MSFEPHKTFLNRTVTAINRYSEGPCKDRDRAQPLHCSPRQHTAHHVARMEFLLVGDRGNKVVPKVAKPQLKEESYTPSHWLQLKHSTVAHAATPALQRLEHIRPSQSYMVITLCQNKKI